MKKEYDVLEQWRKNTFMVSSDLYPDKSIEIRNRENLPVIIEDLRKWFGDEPFIVEQMELQDAINESFIDGNWLQSILFSYNLKSIQAVIEFWQVLKFHESEDSTRITQLKNLLYQKKKRQFRDYYFELYSFYLFSINGIKNEFKTTEGNKELEGELIIDGVKCLVECRKLYYNKFDHLKMNADITHKLIRYIRKKPFGIIVCIKYDELERGAVNEIIKKVKVQIIKWINQPINKIYLPVEVNINDNIEMKLFRYTPGVFESLKSSKELGNYVIVEFNPTAMTDGSKRIHVGIKMANGVVSTDEEVKKRFINSLDKKRKHRSNSSFKHRIYMFESENYQGFDKGLFSPDSFQNISKDLQKRLDSKKTSDTVIMVLKESNPIDVKRVKIMVYSNKGGEQVARKIRSLRLTHH